MNENAKKWVKALRSGEFKQTSGILKDDKGYCCLGVACEIYGRENRKKFKTAESWRGEGETFLGESFALPDEVMDWLGIKNRFGAYETSRSLSSDNDEGKSFQEIADIIEANQNSLFIQEPQSQSS